MIFKPLYTRQMSEQKTQDQVILDEIIDLKNKYEPYSKLYLADEPGELYLVKTLKYYKTLDEHYKNLKHSEQEYVDSMLKSINDDSKKYEPKRPKLKTWKEFTGTEKEYEKYVKEEYNYFRTIDSHYIKKQQIRDNFR